jgi:hypothetical protein
MKFLGALTLKVTLFLKIFCIVSNKLLYKIEIKRYQIKIRKPHKISFSLDKTQSHSPTNLDLERILYFLFKLTLFHLWPIKAYHWYNFSLVEAFIDPYNFLSCLLNYNLIHFSFLSSHHCGHHFNLSWGIKASMLIFFTH